MEVSVARDNLRDVRADKVIQPTPAQGEVVLAVRKFSFTANNISYAVAGEALRYWDFFPRDGGAGKKSRGIVPVWAVADVVASDAPGVSVGARVYGYFPMGSHAVLKPGRVSTRGFLDAAPHRRELPRAYNEYTFAEGDPFYSAATEERMLLLRPLFITSWLLDDFLGAHANFGAEEIVLSSASSKTAIGLAFALRHERRAATVVGLTSRGNAAMVEGLGLYDRVVLYEDLLAGTAGLGGGGAGAVLVDMAGSVKVLRAVHEAYGDALKHSCLVGTSHWQAYERAPRDMPGPRPRFFFAPAWIEKRAAEVEGGVGGLLGAMLPAWRGFVASSAGWLRVARLDGPDAVLRGYADTLAGRIGPSVGTIMSLWPAASKL